MLASTLTAEMSARFPEFFLNLTVVQHKRDVQILQCAEGAFPDAGVVRVNATSTDRMAYRVRAQHSPARTHHSFLHATSAPKREKNVDFLKFREVPRFLMEKGSDLTADGIADIRKIAAGMNRGARRLGDEDPGSSGNRWENIRAKFLVG